MPNEPRKRPTWFGGRHHTRSLGREPSSRFRQSARRVADPAQNVTPERLRRLFKSTPGNFFLRGSAARREPILNDIDVIEIRGSDAPPARELPTSLHGLPIEYATIRAEDFDRYFTVRLRPINDLFETLLIKTTDRFWVSSYERVKSLVSSDVLPAYLLHLYLEDCYVENFFATLRPPVSHSYLKSFPGSKRSLLRYYCAARCISRDLSPRPMDLVVKECERRRLLPAPFAERFKLVSRAIHRGDVGAVHALARETVRWRGPLLRDPVLSEVKGHVSPEIVAAVLDLADPQTSESYLRRIDDLAKAIAPDLQWLLWLGLSAHRHTPVEVLHQLYERCAMSYVYKDIVRNLARNPSCPSRLFNDAITASDQDVRRFLHERHYHHAR